MLLYSLVGLNNIGIHILRFIFALAVHFDFDFYEIFRTYYLLINYKRPPLGFTEVSGVRKHTKLAVWLI